MRVNVFISASKDGQPPSLLVLPLDPGAAIPRHLQDTEWQHFATTLTSDKLLGAKADAIEADITKNGYSIVSPTG